MAANWATMNKNGTPLGYEAEEHAQILTAIRQPLFIQTPLQAMLESLVEKLQMQSGLVNGLQEKVSSLERTNLNQHELLDRVRVLESRLEVSHGASSSLSPFNQQEVLNRLQQLEQKAQQLETQTQQLQYKSDEDTVPRLRMCENRLVGVHNLAGRLMAVDLVAAELGIEVPHPELMTQQQLQQIEQQLSQAQQQQDHLQQYVSSSSRPGTASAIGSSRNSSSGGNTSNSRPGTASQQPTCFNSLLQYQPQHHSAAAAANSTDIGYGSGTAVSRPQSGNVGAGVLTKSKQAELQQQIDAGKEQLAKLQQQIDDLKQQVSVMSSDLSSNQDSTMGVLAGVQDTCQGLSDRLSQQVVQLRKEMAPALQQVQQSSVSLSELAQIQNKLDSTLTAATAASKDIQQLKAKELPALNTAISDLSRRVGPTSVTAVVSDADKALAVDLAGVRSDLSGLAVRLAAQEAGELAKQGVATKEDMQELSRLMVSKANKDDMRAVLGRAVELALEAYRSSVGDADSSGASRTRCLVCERQLIGSRSTSPARDATGSASAASGAAAAAAGKTLPQFASFRPTSSSAAAYTPPAAAGDTLGFGPMGPGLNAAQLRRLADQKRPGTAVAAAAGDFSSSEQGKDGSSDLSTMGGSLNRNLVVTSSSPGQSNTVGQARPQTTGGIRVPRNQAAAGHSAQQPAAVAADGKQQQQGQRQDNAGKRNPVFV